MAPTITVRLNDQVGDGLEPLKRALIETGEAQAATAVDTDNLTEAEQRQIEVIHQHRGAWLQLAASTLHAGATIYSATVQLQRTAHWASVVNNAIGATPKLLGSVTSSLGSFLTRGTGMLRTLPLLGVGITGIGVAAVGTVAAAGSLLSMVSSLDRTIRQAASATAEQRKQLQELRHEAIRTGKSLREVAAAQGVNLNSLALEVESNLSRVAKASNDLIGSVRRPVQAIVGGYRDWALELVGIDSLVAEASKQFKSYTDVVEENLQALKSWADDWADSKFGEGFSAQLESSEKLNRLLEDTRENFDRIRDTNKRLADELANADRQRELAAVRSVGEIDNLMHKERERFGAVASARKMDAQEHAAYENRLRELQQRRIDIQKEQLAESRRLQDQFRKDQLAAEQKHAQELHELERERFEKARALWQQRVALVKSVVHTAEREAFKTAIANMEAEGASAEELHRSKMDQIDLETRQRIEAADSDEARQEAFFEGQRRRLEEEGAFQRQQLHQQVQDRKEAAEEAKRIEREKLDQIKKLMEQNGGPSGQDLIQQQDPRKILAQIQKQRAEEAAKKFREGYGPRDLSNAQAERKFDAGERAARRQAEAQAFRDFQRGNVNPQELANAQVNATNQMLQGLQQNGQLSQQTVQVLSDAARTAAIQEANTAQLQQQVEQLQQHFQETQKGANQTRAKIGSLRR